MRVVVIGGVAGGMSAATRLRRLSEETEIIVIEKSGFVSYANCGLPYYLGGVIKREEDLLLQTPESLHARFRLDVRVKSEVIEINTLEKSVSVVDLRSMETYKLEYDKLILSPGANPVVPSIEGIERAMTLRTVEDTKRIFAAISAKPSTATVIGGGFIGVEMAENLVHQGIRTSIIEATHQILSPLDPEMALLVRDEMVNKGVNVKLGVSVSRIEKNSVFLSDGSSISSDIVILAIGVTPESKLAKEAGLKIGKAPLWSL